VSARLSKAVFSSDKNNRGQLILASSGGKAISSPSRGYTKSTPSGGGSFNCLSQRLSTTELRQLTGITEALLSMSGRVTMRGLSRWAGQGGSYRTVQRFFNTVLDWGQLQWLLIRTHLVDQDDVIVASGDHVVVTKAGKQTHGLDRFFSSLYGKAVPGLCFVSLSLISVKHRKSYPALMEQVEKPSETIPSAPAQAAKKKRQGQSVAKAKRHGGGRPKGSTNRRPREVELSPSLVFIEDVENHVLRAWSEFNGFAS
jgi:putative transposase